MKLLKLFIAIIFLTVNVSAIEFSIAGTAVTSANIASNLPAWVVTSSYTLAVDTTSTLGLGIASPTQKLDVYQNSDALIAGSIRNVHSGTSAHAAWNMSAGLNADPYVQWNINSGQSWYGFIDNSDSDSFKIDTSQTSPNDFFVIETGGQVGIGTSTPGQLLDVYMNADALTALSIRNVNGGSSAHSALNISAGINAHPYLQWSINSGQSWYGFIDDSDSDAFKIDTDIDTPNEFFAITTAGILKQNGAKRLVIGQSLADNATYSLPDAVTGIVSISVEGDNEVIIALVQDDGSVVGLSTNGSTAFTDSDTFLCLYDGGGTTTIIKNALGTTKNITIDFPYQ